MAKTSYLQQIARRDSGGLPLLMPPSPLLRRWEVMQSLEMIPQPTLTTSPTNLRTGRDRTQQRVKQRRRQTEDIRGQQAQFDNSFPSPPSPHSPIPPTGSEIKSVLPTSGNVLNQSPAEPPMGYNLPLTVLTQTPLSDRSQQSMSVPLPHSLKDVTPVRDSQVYPIPDSGELDQISLFAPQSYTSEVTTTQPAQKMRQSLTSTSSVRRESHVPASEVLSKLPGQSLMSIPSTRQPEKEQGAAIHIGSIDVQIVPSPATPVVQVASRPTPPPVTTLSRGFTSAFGLRQG